MFANYKAMKKSLQEKIDSSQPATVAGDYKRAGRAALIMSGVFALPLISTICPSAFVLWLAYFVLTISGIVFLAGASTGLWVTQRMKTFPTDIQELLGKLYQVNQPKARGLGLVVSAAFIGGLVYIGFPVWAAIYTILFTFVHVVLYHYRKVCLSFI